MSAVISLHLTHWPTNRYHYRLITGRPDLSKLLRLISKENPMNVTHLECAACGLKHEARRLHNLCSQCGKPLLVRYDLKSAAASLTKESLRQRAPDLWRYREVLPVEQDENIVTLGEGFTPLLRASRLGAKMGLNRLYIKDEGQNPTQSFKARGMAAAVSMAKELGVEKLAVPSAGNAAGALAAYSARARMEAHTFMTRHKPRAHEIGCGPNRTDKSFGD